MRMRSKHMGCLAPIRRKIHTRVAPNADLAEARCMIAYEQMLAQNLDWALREGSMHFEERSEVHRTLRKICADLSRHGIPYCVVGGMAPGQ